LGALDEFKLHTQEKRHLRFPIQDIYNIDKENIAVGRVEAGIMHENQDVFVLPRKQKCKITKIKKFMQDNLTKAPVGDCVGICAQDAQLNRGEILTDKITATITDSIRANIFWMVKQHYQLGIPLIWKCATQEAEADIERINKRFDSASIDIVENNAKEIRSGEIAEVEIKLDRAVVVDRFTDIREMGRFVLEQEGQPVAGGIIL
jgi:sulfate adenylyltransferase subunit 1 (EFTu-like GTPase family)